MAKELKRVSQVISVAVKHGLAYFLHRNGLKVPFAKRFLTPPKPEYLAVSIRKSMEELGGAYVKLGQLLSIRPDRIPPEFCEEFKKLQDKVPPFQAETAKEIIRRELGRPVSELFSHFDPRPLGSASIAQAHFARLKNGKKVVVKVRRPQIKEIFESDIAVMKYIAKKLAGREKYADFDPVGLVEEFEKYTKKEMNFLNEARNIKKFSRNFRSSGTVKIPEAYDDLSRMSVLTLEYLPGIKLGEVKGRRINKKIVAKHLIDSSLKQVFETDVFHADLHPGNVIVMDNNKVGLLDFGIVGSLDSKLKKRALEMYAALVEKDTDAVVRAIMRTGIITRDFEISDFREDVREIVDEWYGSSLKEARITKMMYYLFNSSMRHGILVPLDLVLLAKALVTVEGTCLELYPEFNFVKYSKPQVSKLIKKEFKKNFSYSQLLKKTRRAEIISEDLVEDAREIMQKVKKGVLEVDIRDGDIKHLGFDVNKSSNRLSYALLIASFIIAAALMTQFEPLCRMCPSFTAALLVLSIVLALPLIISILREGHKKYDPH